VAVFVASRRKKRIWAVDLVLYLPTVAYPGILFGGEGGVQQTQLRAEDRENGDLGAVAPKLGVLEAAAIWYKKFHFI